MNQFRIRFYMIALLRKRYTVRPLLPEDLPQVVEIDREAFPTQWPPPSFSKELSNTLAHYLVDWIDKRAEQGQTQPPSVATARNQGLLSWLRRLFGRGNNSKPVTGQTDYVVGMVGFWLLFDEAHILTIAVRQSFQRQGIGEPLLISTIDLAMQLHAQVVTLEVRPSNTAARALYQTYGFLEQ